MIPLLLFALLAAVIIVTAFVVDARRSRVADPHAVPSAPAALDPSAEAQVAGQTLRVPAQLP